MNSASVPAYANVYGHVRSGIERGKGGVARPSAQFLYRAHEIGLAGGWLGPMDINPNLSYFASLDSGYGKELVGLSQEDRSGHLYVIGKTGMGKSTLLENLIIQDILNGRGCGVIDPHGTLALKLLDCIPPGRWDDVIYFDPAGEREYPKGWNPLRHVPPDDRHLIAENVVSVFRAIWKLTPEKTPRLPRVLYHCIRALLELPSSEPATLLGVPRLLDDPDYRARVLSFVKDQPCRDFWEKEVPKGGQQLSEMIGPVQSRVGAFLQSPDLRRIFGQVKRKAEPRAIMDSRKIFIANLRKGKLGEEAANLIGSFIVTDFESAAFSREELLSANPPMTPVPFYLYVDEFQNITTDSFASSLSEVRKYGLFLTLAQQYQSQMSEEVKSAVVGNVGSIIAFQVGEEDAPTLVKRFAPYPETTLLELSRYDICVKMLRNGQTADPFVATTLPPLPVSVGNRNMVLSRSRRHYARPRAEVERKIGDWLQGRDRPRMELRPSKRYRPEQIVAELRRADGMLGRGRTVPQVLKKLRISQGMYERWRAEYDGLSEEQAQRLKELKRQNARLHKAVGDLTLEKISLEESERDGLELPN